MPDETSSHPPRVHPASDGTPDGDMALLRKEVIESRNLVIKTDNLLKNLHAELKQMGRKHDEQERRHWMTSVAAYIAFAFLAGAGAFAYARAAVQSARDESVQNEARARQLQNEADKGKAAEQSRRAESEKALRVFELLASEKEGPGLNQAMSQAMHLDRALLTSLEVKGIDERAAGMKARVAQAALERGQRAFRQGDWLTASSELGRYVELNPKVDEPLVWYHLGNARTQTKDWQLAIVPLEMFLKSAGGTKTAQYAGMLLGQAYEETGNAEKARATYDRALNLYPGSEWATSLRSRLKRLTAQAQSGPPSPGTPPVTATSAVPR